MGPGVENNDPLLYLRYNEFIVYDIAQIKVKYILRLKFNYGNNAFWWGLESWFGLCKFSFSLLYFLICEKLKYH